MKPDAKLLDAMRQLCDEIGPEDGLDPRHIKRARARKERRDDRKTRQLCGQVARALALALPTAHDPRLREALVDEVTPDPDASRLRVRLAHADPGGLMAALPAARGWLRAEAARSITRKRAPGLVFEVRHDG